MSRNNSNKIRYAMASALGGLMLWGGTAVAHDDHHGRFHDGDRYERNQQAWELDRRGERIARRLDRKGDRIAARLHDRADRLREQGRYAEAHRLDRKAVRIDRRLDRKGERIKRRLDRKADALRDHRPGHHDHRYAYSYEHSGYRPYYYQRDRDDARVGLAIELGRWVFRH